MIIKLIKRIIDFWLWKRNKKREQKDQDKSYFNYSLVVEQLKTEGWQYFQLSGKYENAKSHEQSFKQFCKSIEGVKRKQIEQEYNVVV